MTVYAEVADLQAYVAPDVTVPADAARLLERASELIDEATRGGAAGTWTDPLPDPLTDNQLAVRKATCAQVEFWLSFGEDHDVEGVRGGVQVGAVRIDQLPNDLAVRARRYLRRAGLLSALVAVSN